MAYVTIYATALPIKDEEQLVRLIKKEILELTELDVPVSVFPAPAEDGDAVSIVLFNFTLRTDVASEVMEFTDLAAQEALHDLPVIRKINLSTNNVTLTN
jgi:hypothetical protein